MEDVLTVRQLRAWQAANSGPKIVSWADGTDEEVAAMVAAARPSAASNEQGKEWTWLREPRL